jgi:hypothetical protein
MAKFRYRDHEKQIKEQFKPRRVALFAAVGAQPERVAYSFTHACFSFLRNGWLQRQPHHEARIATTSARAANQRGCTGVNCLDSGRRAVANTRAASLQAAQMCSPGFYAFVGAPQVICPCIIAQVERFGSMCLCRLNQWTSCLEFET